MRQQSCAMTTTKQILILVYDFGISFCYLTGTYVQKCQHSQDPNTNTEKPTANGGTKMIY